jgi:hypothetical protein
LRGEAKENAPNFQCRVNLHRAISGSGVTQTTCFVETNNISFDLSGMAGRRAGLRMILREYMR